MHPGDLAPDFTLPDQNGTGMTLSQILQHGPVALFFYPAAMTTGCTKQSCHFRDLAKEFAALGVQRLGISMDDVSKQKQFEVMHTLDYPLLSDVDGTVARLYSVKRALAFLKVKRTTFAIGADQKIIDVISSEMNMNVHADRALAAFKKS